MSDERLVRLEDMGLADLEALRLILRGDSVIDWHRLNLDGPESVKGYLLAQELRNSVGTAMLSVAVIKRGTVGLHGATAGVLDSVLVTMRDLCDETLAEARRH